MKRFLLLSVLMAAATLAWAEISVEDGVVSAVVDGQEVEVGYLVYDDDDMSSGFDFIYAISPDGGAIAYVGEDEVGYRMFVYSTNLSQAKPIPTDGRITWRSEPVWSTDSLRLAVSVGDRIWLYDRDLDESWVASEPPEDWMEDIDPSFSSDGETLYFYRGSTFEYTFSGELYALDLASGEIWFEPEDVPRYPAEDFADWEGPPYSERDFWMDAAYEKAARFAEDLEDHDFYGLFLAFDTSYAVEQLDLMGEYPSWLAADTVSALLFNGAAMYDDYENTIDSIADIESVIDYWVDDDVGMASFRVLLIDGREVRFSLFLDFGTLDFSGAFG